MIILIMQMFSSLPADHILATHKRDIQAQEKAIEDEKTEKQRNKPTLFSTGIKLVRVYFFRYLLVLNFYEILVAISYNVCLKAVYNVFYHQNYQIVTSFALNN